MVLKGGIINKKDLKLLHKAAKNRQKNENFEFSNRALNMVIPSLRRKKTKKQPNIYKTTRKSLRKTKTVKKNRKSINKTKYKSKTFKKSRKSTNSN
jgi:hypothetical protein